MITLIASSSLWKTFLLTVAFARASIESLLCCALADVSSGDYRMTCSHFWTVNVQQYKIMVRSNCRFAKTSIWMGEILSHRCCAGTNTRLSPPSSDCIMSSLVTSASANTLQRVSSIWMIAWAYRRHGYTVAYSILRQECGWKINRCFSQISFHLAVCNL